MIAPMMIAGAGSRGRGRLGCARRLVFALTLLAATMPGVTLAPPLADAATGATEDVIVVLDPGVDPVQAARDMGVTPTYVYHHVFTGFAGKMSKEWQVSAARRSDVRRISPDRRVRLTAQTLPTGIDRIDADLNADAAIDGVDTRVDADVAVIDTGISPHPDLNVVGGYNCVGSDPLNYQDKNGHGTHVAGTIGAIDNDIAVVGVAPGVRLWAVKVLNKHGAGSNSSVICGLDWVVAHADMIEVANLSLGGPGQDGPCGQGAFHQAFCSVVNAGVPVIVAAGNESQNARHSAPAAYEQVITVSAFADSDGEPGKLGPFTCTNDRDDTFAWFSNFGADVDIAAPGDCILSTWRGNSTKELSGTSMATPHVTGAVALYRAANPGATPDDVRAWLLTTGSRAQTSLVGFTGDPDNFPEPVLYLGP
jgi:subtilisin family serine protease